MNSKGRLFLALPLVLILAAACGCSHGPKIAVLSGKVTYKGQPVTGGSIMFYPQSGGSYTAGIDANGNYTVQNLPAGETAVSVETDSVKRQGTAADSSKGHVPPGGAAASSGGAVSVAPGLKYVNIPAKYTDPKTSGLSVNVTGGKQEKDFALEG